MTQTPDMPERDDPALDWLTQDHRVRLDWSTLDDDQFEAEAAAAMLSVASLQKIEAMPDHLAAKVLAAAHPAVVQAPQAAPSSVSSSPASWWESLRLAWGVASFAGIAAVALAVRLSTLVPDGLPNQTARLQLTEAGHFAILPGPDAAGQAVHGEVVWDASKGGGYLKLAGLPVNDPRREQYQLWIFDGTRDERFPVDGGVFNVERNGEIEVWIRVPIPVRDAAMFAVTVEQAGGTVVSDRGRIVALAKTKT